ncbi:MAG: class I SAM-dependent methyltransferase [Actinomycetota bacterium]
MSGHPIVAAIYDRVLAGNERAGLREMRAELLAGAHGRVLELGAGTGLNLVHYTDRVGELVLTEPDPHMAKRLRRRAAELQRPFELQVAEVSGEQLPFPDHSFDTIVATLVFCTVQEPARTVSELARVLRPDGELLSIEHVRDEQGSSRARWQDRLDRPWGWVAGGCHPNRDTAATLSASFDVSALQTDVMPGTNPPIVKPLIRGIARPIAPT